MVGFAACLCAFISCGAFADDAPMNMAGHLHDMQADDSRVSLGLSAPMKQHQLTTMRGHLQAIKAIVGLVADGKFDEAAKIAHGRLGLTEEMKAMCNMPHNESFAALGMAFHKSADELGDVLQTGNANAALHALNKTMQYCVECHATFRQ
jgi:hypothetical protein